MNPTWLEPTTEPGWAGGGWTKLEVALVKAGGKVSRRRSDDPAAQHPDRHGHLFYRLAEIDLRLALALWRERQRKGNDEPRATTVVQDLERRWNGWAWKPEAR